MEMQDLFVIIGDQTVEIRILRAQVAQLTQELAQVTAKEDEDGTTER